MKAILVFIFVCLIQTVYTDVQQPDVLGITKAILMGNGSPWHATANLTSRMQSKGSSLQFRFSSSSHINGWWCILMFETTESWHDNYLCTNRDIGMYWIWKKVCRADLKCVAAVEPEDNRWHDNAICLSPDSNIELVWSSCSRVAQMDCIHLYDPVAPDYTRDNYLCWKEH
jgi:hypothetical protein